MIDNDLQPYAAVMASGADAVTFNLERRALMRVYVGAGFTGTTLTVSELAPDGSGYVPLTDTSGNAIAFTASASTMIQVSPADFPRVGQIQLTADENQTANVTITCIARPVV